MLHTKGWCIPLHWANPWVNLYRYWHMRDSGFSFVHNITAMILFFVVYADSTIFHFAQVSTDCVNGSSFFMFFVGFSLHTCVDLIASGVQVWGKRFVWECKPFEVYLKGLILTVSLIISHLPVKWVISKLTRSWPIASLDNRPTLEDLYRLWLKIIKNQCNLEIRWQQACYNEITHDRVQFQLFY